MPAMSHRVIQWSTGNAGLRSLRIVLQHPELELVGLHAHSPAKLGKDAAELAGEGAAATGVIATGDVDALLSLAADCVIYMVQGETRPFEVVDELCQILESGTNVVSTSIVSLVYPPFAHPKLREPLEAACKSGGSTLFTSGIDPGFSGDLLPLAMLSLSDRVDSVRCFELMNYATYPDPDFTGEHFGFARPLSYEPPLLRPGALRWGWGGMVQMLADALEIELDEIRESHDRKVSDVAFDCAMGKVEPGMVDAVRFSLEGIVDGRVVVAAEHVNRLRDAAAPDWPSPPPGRGSGYRVEIDGSPRMRCDFELRGPDGDNNTAGITASAARVINAIPAVVAAPPGMVSTLDLPHTPARGWVAR